MAIGRKLLRTSALAVGAVASLAIAPAPPPPTAMTPDGVMVLGYPRAKITVAEYASVGCPHCAHWAHTIYPTFKARYIDTGKARFAFHEMLTGDGALAAAGFLMARCAGVPEYFHVVDQVFAQQNEIIAKGAPVLMAIGKSAGLDDDKFKACLSDEAALKALDQRTDADARAHNVIGTPTFFVNGVKMASDASIADFDAAIAHAKRP